MIAVEFNTMIFVGIFNRSVDTTNVTIATVFSASVVIVTFNLLVSTSYIRITAKLVTLVRIITTVRGISNNASLFLIAVSIMTIIWRNTFVAIISVNTSRVWAA
jgi:hypothetical protein